jgi:hypothetical protein
MLTDEDYNLVPQVLSHGSKGYGLLVSQAPRQWHLLINKAVIHVGNNDQACIVTSVSTCVGSCGQNAP